MGLGSLAKRFESLRPLHYIKKPRKTVKKTVSHGRNPAFTPQFYYTVEPMLCPEIRRNVGEIVGMTTTQTYYTIVLRDWFGKVLSIIIEDGFPTD